MAAEMSNAARHNEAVTTVLRGARYPKLAKMIASQRITMVISGLGIVPPYSSNTTQRCRTTCR